MRNIIFPEQLPEPKKQIRGTKDFTVIATPKKMEYLQYFHCRLHKALRIIYIEGKGYICQFCGPTLPAIREVDTVD